MNDYLDVLKSISKPNKYTIRGKVTIIDAKTGKYIIKKKNKELKELFNYLSSRGFESYPKIILETQSDYIYEYIDSQNIPNEQKINDLIEVLAFLHKKTFFNKSVSEDTYKAIYESIKSNIEYYKNFYNTLFDIEFLSNMPRPSSYHLMRNFTLIKKALLYCEDNLDKWYQKVIKEQKMRVAIVHNKVSLDHFLNGSKNSFVSWDDYIIDTPVVDLINLYKKEYLKYDFKELLDSYQSIFPLLDYEIDLFNIMIMIPPSLGEDIDEFNRCISISNIINYLNKSFLIVGIDNSKEKDEESNNFN